MLRLSPFITVYCCKREDPIPIRLHIVHHFNYFIFCIPVFSAFKYII